MNLYQLKMIKQLLVVIVGLMVILLIRLFTLPNTPYTPSNISPQITVKTDTIWTTLADTFYQNTKQYETVYLTKVDTVYKESKLSKYPVRLYKDSLETKELTIYSEQYIDGILVEGLLSYRLHIPEIIKTVNIKEQSTLLQSG